MNPSNQSQSALPRKTKGRQKISMVKMENQSNLQVTFSKRRAGLFKKASELCTLCGAEAAIVVFSPADKAYCFGHPNAKTVVDRFSAGTAPKPANPRSQLIIDAHRNSTIRELNMELTQVESLLRAEKRRAEEIELVRKAGRMQQWLPASLDQLSHSELCVLKDSIMSFKKNLDAKVQNDILRLRSNNNNNNNNPILSHGQPAYQRIENPSGFPAFNNAPKLSLGMSDFASYDGISGATGISNFAPNDIRMMNNAMFYGNSGINGASSSNIQIEPKDMGSGGLGFSLAHDPRLF